MDILYGCSTTGVEWRFLKYEGKEIILDEKRYLMNELEKLLGILQYILDSSKMKPDLFFIATLF